jgi:hypothetical protein
MRFRESDHTVKGYGRKQILRIGGVVCITVLIFTLGYQLGSALGTAMIKKMLLHQQRYFFIYPPAQAYLTLYNRLNGRDELVRLSGYYALLDHRKIDTAFLFERYEREHALFIKRTIIWVLGFSDKHREVISFFTSIYEDAPLEIKDEILRSVRRLDRKQLHRFTTKK